VTIPVTDPFGAAADPAMPSLARALDPGEAQAQFQRRLPDLAGEAGRIAVRAIRVTRHKPGRRCLVEYDVEVERPDRPRELLTLVGKVRAGRFGKSGYRLLRALHDAGFGADSPDGISVPEPVGTVSAFRMWLQRKVAGRPAGERLATADGVVLARRIAHAAYKLHRAGVPPERRHTMADELEILRRHLPTVAPAGTLAAARIARVVEAAERLGAATPEPVTCGVHRDFYPDQVIVDGERLFLLDFDLYCEGNPALDIGNFVAHITELSLRTLGDPGALADRELAVQERFVELSGTPRAAVRAYATLTLVRHIHLSTLFPDRRRLTPLLIELCEERLGVTRSVPVRPPRALGAAR
jgi:hypothetical protein